VQFQGKKHLLAVGPDDMNDPEPGEHFGPTYRAAVKKFAEIMHLGEADKATDNNEVCVILERYLRWMQTRRKDRTYQIRKTIFQAFINAGYAHIRIRDLKPIHVTDFCDGMRKPRYCSESKRMVAWKNGTVRLAIDSLQVAMNWAVKEGLISRNPIKGAERPAARSRGAECIITPDEHRHLLAKMSPRIGQVLTILENTGARPGEILHAEAKDFDTELGAFVYHGQVNEDGEWSHKTSRKGRARVIFLSGEALALVRELVKQYPAGPLFRPSQPCKRAWPGWREKVLHRMFKKAREKHGLSPRLSMYSYRHTFATNWLKAGRSIDQLAELLGNTPEVIRKHYSHLCGDRKGLRDAFDSFRAPGDGQSPPDRQGGGAGFRVVG
jgi:integrase